MYQNAQGLESRATLVRITRFAAVFETYPTGGVLRVSEVLPEFSIFVNDVLVYSGKAVIKNLVNTGGACLCEVQLDDAWQEAATLASAAPADLKSGFDSFLHSWERTYRINPELKAVVADMHAFLTEMRLWLELVEVGIRSSPSADRIQLEQSIAAELSSPVVTALTSLFEKFEAAVGQVEAEHLPAHRNFCQKQLHPLLLCSPFLYRCFLKPLGYAGDYEMVNMIMGNPYEGSSLFAKLVNTWFLQQPPAQAHRNRIQYLVEQLSAGAVRRSAAGAPLRVFSLGCGPAHEVQSFLRDKDFSDRAQFTLVDFNQETIEHAAECLQRIKSQFTRATQIQMVKKSVNQLLKEAGKTVNRSADQQFDLVYCAGLYDYLTNPICKRLSNILFDWVAPGGTLVLTNVDNSNPRKITMDLIMEWTLLYRDGAEFASLKPEGAPQDWCKVVSDISGVNLYFELRKPECG